MSYLQLAKLKMKSVPATAPVPETWNSETARALVADVLKEQEALNLKWPWPDTRERWEALWELGDGIDAAFLDEDLKALRQAIARWREEASR